MRSFQIGCSVVGEGNAPIFWPDIDVYFKNDLALAFRILHELQGFGVRAIKGAVLQRADICVDTDLTTGYFVAGQGLVFEPYRRIIDRHVTEIESLRRIFGRVRDLGLDLILSVYDDEGIALAEEMGAAAIKIPSSNIVHAPLIRAVASTGRPMVLDTGRSRISEIERAVAWARAAGAERLLVQHSPPGPPAPPTDFHLAMMPELGRRFDAPVSLSDHYAGTEIMFLAVALGASVIEKGVCADETSPDIDIAHALPVSRVGLVLEQLALAHAALGQKIRELPDDYPRPRDRMGLIAARDLSPGEVLTLDRVRFAFPTLGVPVEDWDHVAGRILVRAVAAGEPIDVDNLVAHG